MAANILICLAGSPLSTAVYKRVYPKTVLASCQVPTRVSSKMAAAAARMASRTYRMVDIGANLTNPRFEKDLPDVINRAKQSGIVKMMVTGGSVQESRAASVLARDHPGFLYFTAGVHPHVAKHATPATIHELRELSALDACVAIGECGLDFNRNFSPRDVQLKIFEEQVNLAVELQKPLFIHERDAHTEMTEILDKFAANLPPAVIHCFTATEREAKRYIKMGFYIGLTGFLWKDKSQFGVIYCLENGVIPLDRILIETDAPFMYPNVKAKKKLPPKVIDNLSEHSLNFLKHCSFDRNEPCSLATTVDMIAAYLGTSSEELCRITTENAARVYGLGLGDTA